MFEKVRQLGRSMLGVQEASKERSYTAGEIADVLLSVSPELQESYTRADLELALDDRGWLSSSYSTQMKELDDVSRRTLVVRSRAYWQRDPMAKHAVRLWTDYALADGITLKAQDPATQTRLMAFMNDPRNRKITSSNGQRKSSKKLLLDGEGFFLVFTKNTDAVIRRVDPLQITHKITDPDDEDHILAWRREMPNNKPAIYYAEWTASDDDKVLAEQQKGPNNETVSLKDDVVIYHLPFDDIGDRGNGLLFASIDWSRENRRFMEARVAIAQSLSKYAHKLTVKGGPAVVDAAKRRLESSHVQNGTETIERNPPPAAASTWIGNAGATLEAMPRATGAGDAKQDGDALKLMFCAGTGLMLHYFGDPTTGNLASTTSMELPMLKEFGSYQKLWTDFWHDIFSIVLGEDTTDQEAQRAVIDVDLPPILQGDVDKWATALGAILDRMPQLGVEELEQATLVMLGLNNVDEIMKKVQQKKKDDAAKAATDAAAQAKALAAGAGAAKGMTDAGAKQLAEALQAVSESIASESIA
jgi:hypothetical protein